MNWLVDTLLGKPFKSEIVRIDTSGKEERSGMVRRPGIVKSEASSRGLGSRSSISPPPRGDPGSEGCVKIAYGDLIGGVSGDMFVAALLDLGLPLNKLRAELRKIPTLKFDLKAAKKPVHSIRATQFHVICAKNESPRSWKQIRDLIKRSKLDREVKTTGLEIFTCLAEAEAKIHGIAVDKVHFHEVGATDSIVDIMAAAIGIQELGIDAFHFSRNSVRPRHHPLACTARCPVPGPATLELAQRTPRSSASRSTLKR